jgi:hypothetical protein
MQRDEKPLNIDIVAQWDTKLKHHFVNQKKALELNNVDMIEIDVFVIKIMKL